MAHCSNISSSSSKVHGVLVVQGNRLSCRSWWEVRSLITSFLPVWMHVCMQPARRAAYTCCHRTKEQESWWFIIVLVLFFFFSFKAQLLIWPKPSVLESNKNYEFIIALVVECLCWISSSSSSSCEPFKRCCNLVLGWSASASAIISQPRFFFKKNSRYK